jgi:uncharacterized protein (DUF2236 family)
MNERTLSEVKKKLIRLMRSDPLPTMAGLPSEPLAPVFDRWVAARFDADEVHQMFRLELEYGERAVSEWFAEVLVESGLATGRRLAS